MSTEARLRNNLVHVNCNIVECPQHRNFIYIDILETREIIYITFESFPGVGDPVIYPDLQRHIAPYPGVLFSELTYYDAKPTDNYPNLPVYANPYTTSYNPVYGKSPSLSQYFRPYNQEYFNLYDLNLNSGILKQLYPRLRTQYLNHFSRLQTSRLGLYPLLNVNGLVQQFNPSYNSLISKIYNNFKNIRNGPVTVFVQSKEDPTKLDAIVIQQGLETLGKY